VIPYLLLRVDTPLRNEEGLGIGKLAILESNIKYA
jgi:hypothetical protein